MNRWYLWLLVALIFAGHYMPLPAIADDPAGGTAKPRTVADRDSQAGKTYTATACLLISRKPLHLVFPSTEREDPSEFEVYKATQGQLVKSRFVLMTALRNPKARGLPTLQREGERSRAITWLTSQLRVSFPGKNSEVMTVGFTAPDPKEAATLVNAVVQAYFDEVLNAEQVQRRTRLSELQAVTAERENDLRKRKVELKQLAEQLGAADSASGAIGQRLAVERALASEKELAGLRSDLRRTWGELKVQKETGADCKRLEIQIKVLEEMLQECQKESERLAREAKQLSAMSIDLEMLSTEIRHLEEVLSAVVREREKLRVEIRAAPRVRIYSGPKKLDHDFESNPW